MFSPVSLAASAHMPRGKLCYNEEKAGRAGAENKVGSGMKEGQTKTIVQGALLLTLAGIISKVLSATYRIPLQNLTGDLGFYLYQQVYPVIAIVMILGLYGFPVAVSKVVTERRVNGSINSFRHVYGPLLLIVGSLCVAVAGMLFLLAPQLASWMNDERLLHTYRAAAGLFLLLPFLAVLRGVYQGHERMKPTAYSQVAEQLIRVGLITMIAYLIYSGKLDTSFIGVGGVLASIAGMGVVLIIWLFVAGKERRDGALVATNDTSVPWRYYWRQCLSLGVVAAISHMVLVLMQLVDVASIVPRLIHAGWEPELAMAQKGIFDRGQPLIQFGVVFGSSFALALVPAIVQRQAEKITAIREAILFSFYLSSAASIGIILLMPEVNRLLFMNTLGTTSLQWLAPSIIFSAIAVTACSLLQNMGYTSRAAAWLMAAVLLKGLLNVILVPIMDIQGSAMATTISLLFLMLAMVAVLHKKLPELRWLAHIDWRAFAFAAGSMAVFVFMVKKIILSQLLVSRFGLIWLVFLLVAIGAVIYLCSLLRFGVFTEKQLLALPFSDGLIRLSRSIAKKKEDEDA